MSTLEQRIADVIKAIASEFKKRDAITTSNASNNSGIDEKTLNRIMRCVHAWEKSVDTDGDGLKDYDEYEVHDSNPDEFNKKEDVYDVRVKSFKQTQLTHNISFELTKNGEPIPFTSGSAILTSGNLTHQTPVLRGVLYYGGIPQRNYKLSVVQGDINITKTYIYVSGKLIEA